jgi:MtaA/CmuA family methyltransferase
MNSLQRTISVIRFQPVDKLPVDLHNFLMCAKASGMDYGYFFKDGDAMADAQIKMWQKFHHDVLLLENGTATLAEALGCGVFYRRNEPPAVVRPLLNDIDEVDNLKHEYNTGSYTMLHESLKTTSIVSKQLGDKVFIIGRGDQGPFSLAALLLGMDKLLIEIALGENLSRVHKLLEYCTDFIIKYCIKQIKHGAHCTSIGDSTAGPDVVSPRTYEEFAMPYEKRIIDAVHAAGGLISLHICGNATKIINQMVLTGADILEIDEKTDLMTAKQAACNKTALLGLVSPGILRTGSPEVVKDAAGQNIRIMGKVTGFILGPGCALASDTPDENILALISARDI